MKKLLLSLLLFVWLSFVNLSFWNYSLHTLTEEEREFLIENSISSWTIQNQSAYVLYDFWTEDQNIYNNLCVIFDWFSRTSNFWWRIAFVSSVWVWNAWQFYDINDPSIHCSSWRRRYFLIQSTSTSNKFNINNYYVFDPRILFILNSNLDSCNSDLSSCQSDLDTCQNSVGCDYSEYESQIESLSWDLSSCNSLKNSCISDYGVCSSSLSSCYYDLWNCRAWVCDWQYFSNLFINNIQYPSSSNIFVNVPLEFTYTVDLTWNDTDIDIDYTVDSDYIAWIITTQNSKPTKSDLNYIISSLLPLFVPWLVIILFIYFVFKFIKKVF